MIFLIPLFILFPFITPQEEPAPERDSESAVVVVTCLEPDQISYLEKRFSTFKPAIRFQRASSDDKVLNTMRSLSPHEYPHILFNVSTVVLSSLADRGVLKVWRPEWGEDLPVGLADRDGRWYGIFGDPMEIVYNSQYFGEDQDLLDLLPEGWEDLAAPPCKGSLIFHNPTPFNETGYLFACLIDRAMQLTGDATKGFDLLREIDMNVLRTINPDMEGIFNSRDDMLHHLLSGGRGSISVAPRSALDQCLREGAPINFVLPVEGLFLFPRGMALVRETEESLPVLEALSDKTLLIRMGSEQGPIPLIDESVFDYNVWPGRTLSLDFFPTDHDSVRRNIAAWIGEWQSLIRGKSIEKVRKLDHAVTTVMIVLVPVALVIIILATRSRRKGRRQGI